MAVERIKAVEEEHLAFERSWWGDCANTFGEEDKQLLYAELMGLKAMNTDGHWPVYHVPGDGILDLGGGPVSLLLKCVEFSMATVVDPCPWPEWVHDRYMAHGVTLVQMAAEDFDVGESKVYNEAWIYNVLQHVRDPEKVVAVARRSALRLRIFDWLDTPPHLGHPHTLSQGDLDRWCGGRGASTVLRAQHGCHGRAYSGIFQT